MFTYKHALLIGLGAGLPVLFQAIDHESMLTMAAFGHDLASALLVALAAAMRSFLPSGTASGGGPVT